MKAVLFDMDGTLVDSEKLWDISMHQLYARFGSVMSPSVRDSTVGGSADLTGSNLTNTPETLPFTAADRTGDAAGNLLRIWLIGVFHQHPGQFFPIYFF